MISYAQQKIFTPTEIKLWQRATQLVRAIPDNETMWRCHEVARAVGSELHLVWVDGKCGAVEHTWLITPGTLRDGRRKILDVYVPGAMPPVQLIDTFVLLHFKYTPSDWREDIRHDDIQQIKKAWRRAGY